MKTEEIITSLAEEYAEDATKADASDPNLSASVLLGLKRDLAEYAEEVIRFILRTHCIVEKGAEEATIDGWVARDKFGDIFIYGDKPIRYAGYWFGSTGDLKLPHTSFPSLTWESEPLEVTVTVKPKKQ